MLRGLPNTKYFIVCYMFIYFYNPTHSHITNNLEIMVSKFINYSSIHISDFYSQKLLDLKKYVY